MTYSVSQPAAPAAERVRSTGSIIPVLLLGLGSYGAAGDWGPTSQPDGRRLVVRQTVADRDQNAGDHESGGIRRQEAEQCGSVHEATPILTSGSLASLRRAVIQDSTL